MPSGVLARQIGGVRTLRDFPGSGRDPLLPVTAAAQREALDLMASGVLAADGFVLSPALQRRLAPDFQDRATRVRRRRPGGDRLLAAAQVLDLQRAVLG